MLTDELVVLRTSWKTIPCRRPRRRQEPLGSWPATPGPALGR